MDEAKIGETLTDLYRQFDAAAADNRLPGYIDDRMLELEEGNPGLYKLLQHLMADTPEDCDQEQACHLLFVMAYTIYRVQTAKV